MPIVTLLSRRPDRHCTSRIGGLGADLECDEQVHALRRDGQRRAFGRRRDRPDGRDGCGAEKLLEARERHRPDHTIGLDADALLQRANALVERVDRARAPGSPGPTRNAPRSLRCHELSP
jgi:hypothetical protein